MKFKRLLAFVISASMIVGMFPAFVLADETGSEPAETTVAETTAPKETEPAATKEKKPEEKKPEEKEPEEPAETKEKTPEQTEDKKPADSEDKQPEETKSAETEPEETKPEETKPEETKPEETKPQESSEPDKTEPAETTKPSESEPEETEPSASESSVPAWLDEPTGEVTATAKGKILSDHKDGERNNDDLFNRFAESKLYKSKARRALYASSGSRLTGINKKIYDLLVPKLREVAEGKATSTEFEFTISELGLNGLEFTADQLGVNDVAVYNSKTGKYDVTDEAYNAMYARLRLSIVSINDSILADLPYELYWYDKTYYDADEQISAIRMFLPNVKASHYESSGWKARYDGSISVKLVVAQGYAKSLYVTDTSKITRVNTAVNTAKSVVNDVKTKSDYEKLVYYRDWICKEVYYDHSALGGAVPYGDPWQLISAFDKDPNTNIVCEGYSKAFKYLCDLTTFNKDISCILATGDIPAGGHMWNIVNMEDGKNYLVDVTNCDSGTVGYPDQLFLVGYYSGNVNTGYVFKTKRSSTLYIYDEYTMESFDKKDLTISAQSYLAGLDVGGDLGNGVSWHLKADVLTISGNGAMPDFADETSTPWHGYAGFIKKVVIEEGVTTAGKNAFEYCINLSSVSLPNSLTSIGDYAFAATGLTGVTVPGSVSSIGLGAFSGCSLLTELTLLNGVKTIGEGSFYGTGLTGVIFPSSVTEIGISAFAGMKDLTSVTFLGDVKTIGKRAFKDAGITSVVIPESVATLGSSSFENCTKLKNLTISKNLYNNSGAAAFVNCPLLVSPVFYETDKAVVNEVAKSGDYVFKVTGTGTACFMGVSNPVEAVAVPATVVIKGATYKVTSIGVKAMYRNPAVKTVYIGSNVASVGNYAFCSCSNLVRVSGGAKVKTIGNYAFARNTKLSTFVIASKVLWKIGQNAFYNDGKLKTIYIKNTTKLTKSGVKKSLKGSSVKTVKVKKSKVKKYKKFFAKKNSGRSVKVKK